MTSQIIRKSSQLNKALEIFFGISGTSLLAVGGLKIASTLSLQWALGLSICGSGPFTFSSIFNFNNGLHCWGCPIALIGLSVLALSALMTALPKFSSARQEIFFANSQQLNWGAK